MTTQDSNNNPTIVCNGCSFETLVPEKVITLPRKNIVEKFKYFIRRFSPLTLFHEPSPGVPVQLGIAITNQTSKPLNFLFHGFLIPGLFQENERIFWGGFSLRPAAGLWELRLVMPRERTVFYRHLNLFWLWRNEYAFSLRVDGSSQFITDPLNPGKYQVQFTYSSSQERLTIPGSTFRETTLVEDIWTGEVSTPFVEIELVKPIP